MSCTVKILQLRPYGDKLMPEIIADGQRLTVIDAGVVAFAEVAGALICLKLGFPTAKQSLSRSEDGSILNIT